MKGEAKRIYIYIYMYLYIWVYLITHLHIRFKHIISYFYQATKFLSLHVKHVHLLIRRRPLEETMSDYLITRYAINQYIFILSLSLSLKHTFLSFLPLFLTPILSLKQMFISLYPSFSLSLFFSLFSSLLFSTAFSLHVSPFLRVWLLFLP